MLIRHVNGVEIIGEVLEMNPPQRLVFTYGYASGQPISPGRSTVTIELRGHSSGTQLHLVHASSDPAARDLHEQGWRFHLSVFGRVVAEEVFADPNALTDSWFEAWAVRDSEARSSALGSVTVPCVDYRDPFSLLEGLGDPVAHTGAMQRFMPRFHLRQMRASARAL